MIKNELDLFKTMYYCIEVQDRWVEMWNRGSKWIANPSEHQIAFAH